MVTSSDMRNLFYNTMLDISIQSNWVTRKNLVNSIYIQLGLICCTIIEILKESKLTIDGMQLIGIDKIITNNNCPNEFKLLLEYIKELKLAITKYHKIKKICLNHLDIIKYNTHLTKYILQQSKSVMELAKYIYSKSLFKFCLKNLISF